MLLAGIRRPAPPGKGPGPKPPAAVHLSHGTNTSRLQATDSKKLAFWRAACLISRQEVEGNETKLLALVLLAGGSLFAETRFSVGINIGGYAPGYYPPPPPPEKRVS